MFLRDVVASVDAIVDKVDAIRQELGLVEVSDDAR
jgi:hypothetical protein